MAGRRRKNGEARQTEGELRGNRLIKPIQHLIEKLHPVGTDGVRAGNRKLFFDQYITLVLLYFFTPSLDSLRALQEATGWEKTRKTLGIGRTSLGSLSQAADLFDATRLEPIIEELAAPGAPLSAGRGGRGPQGADRRRRVDLCRPVADGLGGFGDGPESRGVKLHLHFDVLKAVPCQAAVTPAACSETRQLEAMLPPGRLYVVDRGYADYDLFAQIVAAGSSLVARVKDSTAFTVAEERPLDAAAARKAGVVRDAVLSRLGTSHHKDHLKRPMRLVIVRAVNREGQATELWLVTDRLDLDADLVALAYRAVAMDGGTVFPLAEVDPRSAAPDRAEPQRGDAADVRGDLVNESVDRAEDGPQAAKRTFETIQFYLLGWVGDAGSRRTASKLKEAEARSKKTS